MKRFVAERIGMVILTEERLRHIVERHPEVKPSLRHVATVLAKPETIRRSRYDPYVFIFYRRVGRDRHLAIVVKTNKKNFILTAYLTDRIIRASHI